MMTSKKVVACKLPRLQAGTLKTTFTSLVGGWAVNWQLRQLPLLPQYCNAGRQTGANDDA
jgi:hypothetical protein